MRPTSPRSGTGDEPQTATREELRRIHVRTALLRLDKEAQAKVDKMHGGNGCGHGQRDRQYDRPAVEGGTSRQHQPLAELGSENYASYNQAPDDLIPRNETNSNSPLQHPRTHRGPHSEHPQGGMRLAGDGARQ